VLLAGITAAVISCIEVLTEEVSLILIRVETEELLTITDEVSSKRKEETEELLKKLKGEEGVEGHESSLEELSEEKERLSEEKELVEEK
jgi:ATP phosphoribosyltransferase regulatory subunit HisZ